MREQECRPLVSTLVIALPAAALRLYDWAFWPFSGDETPWLLLKGVFRVAHGSLSRTVATVAAVRVALLPQHLLHC